MNIAKNDIEKHKLATRLQVTEHEVWMVNGRSEVTGVWEDGLKMNDLYKIETKEIPIIMNMKTPTHNKCQSRKMKVLGKTSQNVCKKVTTQRRFMSWKKRLK